MEKPNVLNHVHEAANSKNKEEEPMAIDKELLEILACPKCKGDIVLTETEDGLICNECKLKYPIKDDIPVMLVDEAEKLD
jgi:uncharacterized protein YbaR (Trm112 family)